MGAHAPEQSTDGGIRVQQLKDAIGGDDQINRVAQSEVGDVPDLNSGFGEGNRRRLEFLAAKGEHPLRPIDAMHVATHLDQGGQHTARTTPQFQHRSVWGRNESFVEGAIIRDGRIEIVVLRGHRSNGD
jgi:hypothetical protein